MKIMKYSSCITNPSIINQPFFGILQAFVDAGFDAIDIPGDTEKFSVKKIQEGMESFKGKIRLGEITAAMNPSLDLIHPSESNRNKAIDYVKYCIDTAAQLGSFTHFCFLSVPENLEKNPRTKLESLAIDSIKKLSNHAEKAGVRLLIEPLFKGDVSLINRCEQAVFIYSKALGISEDDFLKGGSNFGLLQDLFHMHNEEFDFLGALRKYNKCTYHIHVADHPRGLDFSRNDSGFVAQAIKELKTLNYPYLLSFESFDPKFGLSSLKKSLTQLKSFET
jgi:D-psicose/D-tagatose/L-ribulose 3-epimerase